MPGGSTAGVHLYGPDNDLRTDFALAQVPHSSQDQSPRGPHVTMELGLGAGPELTSWQILA